MVYNFDIKVPQSLRDIKLKDWIKFIDVYEKNKDNPSDEFLNKKMLEIFCGVNLKELHSLPVSSFSSIVGHLYSILNTKPQLTNRFEMIGADKEKVQFGLIPNFDKMSYGEWEDLENYMYEDKNMHRAMAVLYRPVVYSIGDKYRIHKYEGTDYYADIMKDMPIDIALGAKVFFYRLARKLGLYTMDSIVNEYQTEAETASQKDSQENGEVIKQYLNLRKGMLEGLTK